VEKQPIDQYTKKKVHRGSDQSYTETFSFTIIYYY